MPHFHPHSLESREEKAQQDGAEASSPRSEGRGQLREHRAGDCAGLGRRRGTRAPLLRPGRFSLILKRCWWCQTGTAWTPANAISQKRGQERAQLMSADSRARTWAVYNLPLAHVPALERARESSQGHEGRNTSVGGSQRKRTTKKGSSEPKRKASCCCLGGGRGRRQGREPATHILMLEEQIKMNWA